VVLRQTTLNWFVWQPTVAANVVLQVLTTCGNTLADAEFKQ